MVEKLFEPRIAVHAGTPANKAIDHAVCRSENFPENDGFEYQAFGIADEKNTCRIEHFCQVPPFCFVENKDGAARSEVPDGCTNSLFFVRHLAWRRTFNAGALRPVFCVAP